MSDEKPPHACQPLNPEYLRGVIDGVIACRPDITTQGFTAEGLAGWVVGKVMKATHGKANPHEVAAIVREIAAKAPSDPPRP